MNKYGLRKPRDNKRATSILTIGRVKTVYFGPVHGAVGVVLNIPLYSSGYVHPATAVTPPAVSASLNHPASAEICPVLEGGGMVITSPVVVYVGKRFIGTLTPEIDGGGQGKRLVDEGRISFDDAPPVMNG